MPICVSNEFLEDLKSNGESALIKAVANELLNARSYMAKYKKEIGELKNEIKELEESFTKELNELQDLSDMPAPKFKYSLKEREIEKFNISHNRTIKRGSLVEDCFGAKGIVVRLGPPTAAELEEDPNWHGWIDVWQLDKESSGADNCESYCYTNWKECLKVIEE